MCPLYSNDNERHSLAIPSCQHQSKLSVACSADIASPISNNDNDSLQLKRNLYTIDLNENGKYKKEYEKNNQRVNYDLYQQRKDNVIERCHLQEEDLKKSCEKLCEQIQWKAENHHPDIIRSNFQEKFIHYQASLHALHEETTCLNEENSNKGTTKETLHGRNDFHVFFKNKEKSMLNSSKFHESFNDVNFARPMWKCGKERPMSAPIHEHMQRVTSSRQRLLPEDLLQRYPMDNCIWTPQSRKERCIKNKGIKSKDDVAIPLRPISLLQNVERFRSKSVELKKPRFRTETTCGKGEEMPKDSAKKMLKVLPVIALDCDKNKSMWNCKANKKEWDAKHQGCCSQHWVSLLNKNEKVSLKKEQKIPRKVYFSPSSKSKFAEMAMQKTQVSWPPDILIKKNTSIVIIDVCLFDHIKGFKLF